MKNILNVIQLNFSRKWKLTFSNQEPKTMVLSNRSLSSKQTISISSISWPLLGYKVNGEEKFDFLLSNSIGHSPHSSHLQTKATHFIWNRFDFLPNWELSSGYRSKISNYFFCLTGLICISWYWLTSCTPPEKIGKIAYFCLIWKEIWSELQFFW